jgi:hypothetical protein
MCNHWIKELSVNIMQLSRVQLILLDDKHTEAMNTREWQQSSNGGTQWKLMNWKTLNLEIYLSIIFSVSALYRFFS